MADTDLDELERLAKAATPGPWEVGAGGSMETFVSIDGDDRCIADIKISLNDERDAAYIASMHPGTTLALIERIGELEGNKKQKSKSLQEMLEIDLPVDMQDLHKKFQAYVDSYIAGRSHKELVKIIDEAMQRDVIR